jgi:hypothetical protein
MKENMIVRKWKKTIQEKWRCKEKLAAKYLV